MGIDLGVLSTKQRESNGNTKGMVICDERQVSCKWVLSLLGLLICAPSQVQSLVCRSA